jgi:hypothetical protein
MINDRQEIVFDRRRSKVADLPFILIGKKYI